MKKFKDISEFEKLVKTQLENNSTPPPYKVWNNIDFSSTNQSVTKGAKIIELIKNPIKAIKIASIVGVSATILFLAVDNQNSRSKEVAHNLIEDSQAIVEDSTSNIQSKISSNKDQKYKESKHWSKPSNNEMVNAHKQPLPPKEIIKVENHTPNSIGNAKVSNQLNIGETLQKIIVSNKQPCIGETIILESTSPGDWYINNEIIVKNTDNFEHVVVSDKPMFIALKNEFGEINEIISSINPKYQIINQKINHNTYTFSINKQGINANWYLDGSLVSENNNVCKIEELSVGKHEIKTIPVNAKCLSENSTILDIKSTGSIKFFNVFTPNGDGTNDEYPVEISNYENYQILIFDQMNNKIIFTSNDPKNRWNGSINNIGENCPPGEYLAKIKYTLKGEKPQIKNIKFTLIRP